MTTACQVAEAFFAAIEAGDIARIEALYATDAVIWHNTDGQVQSVRENLRVLRWMVEKIPRRTYDVLRRIEVPGGFVQQHVLRLATYKGSFEMPACILAQVEHGRIHRLDEYLDSAHVAAMRTSLGL